jgi:hypothetical protein
MADALDPGLRLLLGLATAGGWIRGPLLPSGGPVPTTAVPAAALRWLPAMVLLPALPFPAPISRLLFGKEGIIEAITEGTLLALVVFALRHRLWAFAAGTFVLLGEEWDWGQRLHGIPTPRVLLDWGSRSTQLNFHNVPPWDGLWRVVPLLLVVACARRPWRWNEPLARRLGLPSFQRGLPLLLLLTLTLSVLAWPVAGEFAVDEVAEAVLVVLAAASVVAGPSTPRSPTRPSP